jgi:predicted phosphatase
MPASDRNLCGEMRVISLDNRRAHMPEIRENDGVVTQITTVKVPSDNQSEVLELMKERARFMASQPGFVGQPAS